MILAKFHYPHKIQHRNLSLTALISIHILSPECIWCSLCHDSQVTLYYEVFRQTLCILSTFEYSRKAPIMCDVPVLLSVRPSERIISAAATGQISLELIFGTLVTVWPEMSNWFKTGQKYGPLSSRRHKICHRSIFL
jgi:hypothetical protein